MADEDILKRIEERLTRLEVTLGQQPTGPGGFTPPGGTVVDPSPFPQGGRWGFFPWPRPVVDPVPWPHPVVDPVPWPHPVVDPAPRPGFQLPGTATTFGRLGTVADPAPMDFSRLNISQLEVALHSINAEKARLDSLEGLVKQHLERAKKQPG